MALSSGAKLGAYEILAPIGAGGMGEVYRARDTKLGRDVAIKVLPDELAADAERVARFEREAKVLASLNHPNIAGIYGVESHALVLELVEGATLAERIAEGPVPVDEALAIAKQIADALEAGHEAGVVHRDLKPANIKVKDDGTVKVLDYGLAKALEGESADGVDSALSHSPTMTRQGTQLGVVLGTAAYMSPEQAKGKRVDKRTDIWAFGAVVYEMLTGKRAFEGEDVSETLASVIKSEPDWNALPEDVSPRLRALVQRCLVKDVQTRRRDIGDVRIDLEEALAHPEVPAGPATPPRRTWQRALPVATLVAGILFGIAVSRRSAPERPVLRFPIPLAEKVSFSNMGRHVLALSPDGKRLAHTGNERIYLREMGQMDAVPVRGTEVGNEGGRSPFFSPDGEWLGFWADGQLKKVAVSGGAPITLCDAENPYGASWSEDDTIVYGQGAAGIWRVSGSGGEPERLVEVHEGERLAHGPQMLPGGKAILFTLGGPTNWDDAKIVVQSLDDGERRVLIDGGSDARYVASGHLVYARGAVLFAVPFDVDTHEVSGGPVSVVEDVQRALLGITGAAHFSVSKSGTLAHVGGRFGTSVELAWVELDGSRAPVTERRLAYDRPRLSPDGGRIAFHVSGPDGPDVWILDVERVTSSRLTIGGRSRFPVWSPDGEWVGFSSSRDDKTSAYRRRADFSGEAELLFEEEEDVFLEDWSRNDWLIYTARGRDGVWARPLDGSDAPRPIVRTGAVTGEPSFSPDGQWVLFQSDATRHLEFYVTPFDASGRRYQISTEGATHAVWSPLGDRIFYAYEHEFYAVDVATEPEFRAGPPRHLFEAPYRITTGRPFDISPDGERFVAVLGTGEEERNIDVVVNWLEELKERVPVP